MNSHVLRSFIRETIYDVDFQVLVIERDLGAEREIQDYKKEKAAGQIPLSARDMPMPIQKTDLRIGEMGVIYTAGGEPDFVVIAQNPKANNIVIRRHSKSDSSISDEDFEEKLGAIAITPRSPIVNAVLIGMSPEEGDGTYLGNSSLNGWYILEKDKSALSKENNAAAEVETTIGPGYYLLDSSKTFVEPRDVYTSKFRQSVESFGCELPIEESFRIIRENEVNTQEWALAVACFYDYANSFKYTATGFLAGGSIGAALGGIYGAIMYKHPVAALAYAGKNFLTGASWGVVAADAILRWPVLLWSWKTGRKMFFWSNFIYLILIIGFQSLSQYSGLVAKASPSAALSATKSAISAIASATKISAVNNLVMKFTSSTWSVLLAEVIVTLASSIFGDVVLQADKDAIIQFLENPDLLEGDLKESRTALINDLRTRFPDR
jgi:hypothetical protein